MSTRSDRYRAILRKTGILASVLVWIFVSSCIQIVPVCRATGIPARIDRVRIIPSGLMKRDEFRKLRSFEVPGACDRESLDRTRSNIIETRRFKDVDFEILSDNGENILVIRLTPQPYIRSIRFKGESQMDAGQILKRIDFNKYTALSDDSVPKAAEQIRTAYQRSGFASPDVTIQMGNPKHDGGIRATVRVSEQPLPRLGSFEVRMAGVPGWFTRLRLKTSMWLFGVNSRLRGMNEVKLDQLLNRLQREKRRNGYQQAVFRKTTESVSGLISAGIDLDLGKKIEVKTKGIGWLTRRDVLNPVRQRSVALDELQGRRLAVRFEKKLMEQGYLDASVTPQWEETPERRILHLNADRGIRYHVSDLVFEGNQSVDSEELKKAAYLHAPRWMGLSRSRPDGKSIETSINSLRKFYASRGYPDVRIDVDDLQAKPDSRIIRYSIQEGDRFLLGDLSFPGAETFEKKELLQITGLKTSGFYDPALIRDAELKLEKSYREKGYTDITIRIRLERTEEHRMNVVFEMNEGMAYTIGTTIVRNNYKTSTPFIYSSRRFKTGQPFSYEPLGRWQQKLYQSNVFESVTIQTTDQPERTPPQKDIIIDVREHPTAWIKGSIDVNTDRGLEATGTIGDRDLLGRAIGVSLTGLAGSKRNNISLSFAQPFLFNTWVHQFMKISYEEDHSHTGFTLADFSTSIGLSREFGRYTRGSLTYNFERQSAFDIEDDVDLEVEYDTGDVASITPQFIYDSRDDPFNTGKGTLVNSQMKSSLPDLGAQLAFHKLEANGRWFQTLPHEFILGANLRSGRIWTIGGGDELPLGERFFLGGASTHRGFSLDELGPIGEDGNPLGGRSYILANLECRFPIWEQIYGGLFIDAGNVYLDTPEPPYIRPVAGLGLRYQTPVGPLRCDIGFNLDRRKGESSYALHFAIGHAF